MYRKMIRFTLGRWCKGRTTPPEVPISPPDAAARAGMSRARSEARAIEPSPIEERRRKARRFVEVSTSRIWRIGLLPRDRLVEVQDRAGHRGPGGEFRRVEGGVGGSLTDP